MPKHAASRESEGGSSMKFLFLASHGLQTPLSAIRWGSGRLKKSDLGKLTKEQRHLIEHIHTNAKILSKLLGSMLILARSEEGAYQPHLEPIYLPDLIERAADSAARPGLAFDSSVPNVTIAADRQVLAILIENLFAIFTEASAKRQRVRVQVKRSAVSLNVTFSGELNLALLEPQSGQRGETIVTGTPGLFFSLVATLARSTHGTLILRPLKRKDAYEIVLNVPSGR